MSQAKARDRIYRRRRFEGEIIELCVRWYITYRLSYRDLVAMMAERGIRMSHTTILRWVVHYVPEFEKRWNRSVLPALRLPGRAVHPAVALPLHPQERARPRHVRGHAEGAGGAAAEAGPGRRAP